VHLDRKTKTVAIEINGLIDVVHDVSNRCHLATSSVKGTEALVTCES
jgi:hypothetical protein